MRNFNEELLNFTRNSNLYCVWVPVQDDAGDRLEAIWVDPAMSAFPSFAAKVSNGIDGAATHFAGHQEEDVHLSAGEHVTSLLRPHS